MLEALARAFAERGHHVTVLTTRAPTGERIDLPGVLIKRAPVLRDRSGYVRGYLPYLSFDIPLFFRLLFARRADVYVVEPPPTTGVVVRVAASLLRRPYIYDAADIWADAAKQTTASTIVLRALRSMERFAWRGSAHKLTISSGVEARMRELGDRTPTTVVGFGVDGSTFRHVQTSSTVGRTLVYAGSYSEWHGASIFVEALAKVRTPGVTLLYVGNGADRPLIESRMRETDLRSVRFRPTVDGEELNRIFNESTASLASLKPDAGYDYAFTTKVYASLAAGCPVVFTGSGPTAAFIREGAQSWPVGTAVAYDAAAVAAAIDAALANPLDARERSELSSWARERFAFSALAARVVTIAEGIVKQ